MAEKNKKKINEVAMELYLAMQSDNYTPKIGEMVLKGSGYTGPQISKYMKSEAFQSQVMGEQQQRDQRALEGVRLEREMERTNKASAEAYEKENQDYSPAIMTLERNWLGDGFGGGGIKPPSSDIEQARRALESIAQRQPIGKITSGVMNLPVPSVQAPAQNTAAEPYVEPGTDISRDEREFGPSGQGQFKGLVRIPGQAARQTYEMVKNAMRGAQTIYRDPNVQALLYGTDGTRPPEVFPDRPQQSPAGLNASPATAAPPRVASPMADVGGPSASPAPLPAPAPAPAAQPQPFKPTPGGMGFYLGGSMPSPTQDQGLANIQNAYAQGQLPVPPSQYISMRQQAMREAMRTGQPMVVSGEFPGMVMIGGTPSGGITSAPIDGRGGFDPATARVAKAYNERINQMVAEGRTPTRQEQVQIQQDLVQQERDAQASFEDKFARARAAGLAAGGGAGDPEANRARYMQDLANMQRVSELSDATSFAGRQRAREAEKRQSEAEARAAREGKLTPQQQMAEAERDRQSKERIAGVGGVRQTAEQKALQKEYEQRVDRQSAINTTRIQRGIQSSIQRITSAAGTVGLTEEQKQDFKRLDALQKEPTWKSFIKEMTATGEFPDDPTMKSLSEQFNAALNTEEPSAYLRNIESLYDAWLKTS